MISPRHTQFYRADIDGLRALAICSVLLFHCFPAYFPGGFVGVDVFFVISGFIITQIVSNEINNNCFSFISFYNRRIKKLFPALLIIFGISLLFGWLFFFPADFKRMAGSLYYGTISLANNYFYRHGAGYFEINVEKPFLHLWSLSIEEQFYLFFVPLFYFSSRVPLLWENRIKIIIVLMILSFFLNIYFLNKNPNFSFFSLSTRFWEIMLGIVLSLKAYEQSDQFLLRNIFACLGMMLIILSIFLFNSNQWYPGWRALLPTGGTAFLIAAGKDAWLNSKIFSKPIPVFIGLMSYSLYIVHWPILIMVKTVFPEIGNLYSTKVILLFVIILVATFAFYSEKKIRNTRSYISAVLLMISLGIIAAISFSFYKGKHTVYLFRSYQNIFSAIDDWDYPSKDFKSKNFRKFIFYEIGSNSKKVLFFGDSNVEQYSPRISALIRRNPYVLKSAVFLTQGGCMPVPNVFEDDHPFCIGFVEAARKLAADPHISRVVIGAQWIGYLNARNYYFYQEQRGRCPVSDCKELVYLALEAMIQDIRAMGKVVYLILPMPIGKEYDPKEFIKRTFWGGVLYKIPDANARTWHELSKDTRLQLKRIASKTGAIIIDPTDYLCNKVRCKNIENKEPVYKDGCHLRAAFVKEHIHFLDDIITKE